MQSRILYTPVSVASLGIYGREERAAYSPVIQFIFYQTKITHLPWSYSQNSYVMKNIHENHSIRDSLIYAQAG